MKKFSTDTIFSIINNMFMIVILVVMIYPLYFTVIASISDPGKLADGKVMFVPVGFTFEAYENVIKSAKIWIGYRNTIIYTVFGTIFNLILTLPAAYAWSKKNLIGRNAISWYFLFTMYFSGGLIPYYLLVRSLNLQNKFYTLIILGGISIFNMVVTRIFFQTSIPDELYDAASIDGASNYRIFFQIALPLSAPIIAVMSLFYGVARWNDYFTAMIFQNERNSYPLQLVLQSILIFNDSIVDMIALRVDDPSYMETVIRQRALAETMKYSLIFIASAPLLIAYPFLQKYFIKGMMIGSLKG